MYIKTFASRDPPPFPPTNLCRGAPRLDRLEPPIHGILPRLPRLSIVMGPLGVKDQHVKGPWCEKQLVRHPVLVLARHVARVDPEPSQGPGALGAEGGLEGGRVGFPRVEVDPHGAVGAVDGRGLAVRRADGVEEGGLAGLPKADEHHLGHSAPLGALALDALEVLADGFQALVDDFCRGVCPGVGREGVDGITIRIDGCGEFRAAEKGVRRDAS